jgi:hypothetical protein
MVKLTLSEQLWLLPVLYLLLYAKPGREQMHIFSELA